MIAPVVGFIAGNWRLVALAGVAAGAVGWHFHETSRAYDRGETAAEARHAAALAALEAQWEAAALRAQADVAANRAAAEAAADGERAANARIAALKRQGRPEAAAEDAAGYLGRAP